MNVNETTSRRSNKSIWLLVGAMILVFFVIVSIFDPNKSFYGTNNQTDNNQEDTSAVTKNPITINALASIQPLEWMKTGPEKAPVNIVVFFDFTCVHCAASWPAIRSLATNYGDKVHLILRDRTPSTESLNLAIAAHCAGEQGKFWEIFDYFYQSQAANLGADINKVTLIGKQLGLDSTKFNNCLRSDTYKQKVATDMTRQEKLGVKGTPTWFVNGEKLEGEMTVQEASKVVNAVLGNNKK